MNAGCPAPDQLRHWLAGYPAADEEAGLAGHVETCPRCQQLLERFTTPEQPIGSSVNLFPERTTSGTSDSVLQRLIQGRPSFGSKWALFSSSTARSTRETTDTPRPLPAIPDYEILGELGSGGMGIVYQARQLGLNRLVALKMLRAEDDASSLARFRAEAEAVARLHHPNIVQIYEIGAVEGRPFLCLEFVGGGNLAERLAGTPFPAREAAALTATLARAVHHAHLQGVVHRDLKPANILLAQKSEMRTAKSETGKRTIADFPSSELKLVADFGSRISDLIPKVTDFGLAKQLDRDLQQTKTGNIMGTPSYMAPEQASGHSRRIGPGVDIYSLGAILYELLTARPPFHGATPLETLLQVIHAEPVPPRRLQPSVPLDLETITLKCLEKEQARRYTTAQELAADLDRFLAGEPIAARPPSMLYHVRKFARRHKAVVGGLVSTLLVLVAGIISTSFFAVDEARLRQEADSNAYAAYQARAAALGEAYQARLMAALGMLQDHRVEEATRQLNAAPAPLRDWEWRHLHSKLDDSLLHFSFPGGESRVTLAWVEGRWRALIIPHQQTPRLWDVARRESLASINVANAFQSWALPSRNGTQYLLEQYTDERAGFIVLMEDQEKELWRIPCPRSYHLNSAAISPDGKLLALALHNEGAFTLYDAATGRLQKRLESPGVSHTTSFAFSLDGQWLASGDANGSVHLWRLATGTRETLLRRHRSRVTALSFSPDSKRLVSGAEDRLLCQWEVSSGRLLSVLSGHAGPIGVAAYSPDGRWIASGGREGTVRIWSVADEETAFIFHGHTAAVYQLLWNPDGTELASATNHDVRIWGLVPGGSPCILRDHRSSLYASAYSPDGRWFATAGWDDRLRIWDSSTGAVVAAFVTPTWMGSIAFSPDGQTLVGRVFDRILCVWDIPSRRLLKTIDHHASMYQAYMHTVTISPDGRLMAAGRGSDVRLWEMATFQERPSLHLPTKDIRLAVFSPDSKRLAAVGVDHVIYIVSVETGQVLQTLRGHEGVVQVIAFHPDGRRLVSAGADPGVRLWDTASGKLLRTLQGHNGEVFAAAFHPDGTRLATGGRDRIIRFWDTNTGDPLLWLEGHRSVIFSLVFSPNGHTLVSTSGDGTVRLWDDYPVSQRFQARREMQGVSGK